MPPRYFTSRNVPSEALSCDPQSISHLLDIFVLEAPHRAPEEWYVGLDSIGGLVAVSATERAQLTQTAQEEISFNEVSGITPRRLLFSEVSLLLVQLVEQPPNTPGVDDPVYLYGTLYGPIPRGPSAWTALEGQLTVTRADVLEGVTAASNWAFRYPNGGRGRCFSMLLPGDRPDELSQGRGAVLAYALLAPELAVEDAANDIMINQILYDMLSAMKEDMKSEGAPPDPLPLLPVPSRATYEQSLLSAGYVIEGGFAVKKDQQKKGFFASLFGKDKLELPAQGTTEQYLTFSKEALKGLPGWPMPRAQSLRMRQLQGGGKSPFVQAPLQPSSTEYTPPPPPPPPSRPRPSDWMNDFIESHHKPGAPPARLTPAIRQRPAPEPAPAPPPRIPNKPDWMNDFEQSSAPAPKASQPPPQAQPKPQAKPKSSSKKPDWMDDFE